MIYVISDTRVPERMAKLPEKFLERIKPDGIIFSCGSKIGHAGDFVNWETFRILQSLATLYAVWQLWTIRR